MFLLSWNVAGWTTTVAGIRSTVGSVAEFFRRTGADVICIQEAKVGRKKVNESPRESGACDTGNDFDGWDSFWSCSENNRSFNGVTTFVKKGLTARADAKPFRNAEFDAEGRCIVTYHAQVVIFNVYVPNARDGERYAYKRRFLGALREAMKRVRHESSLPVILCGDMNMTYRVEDCHFSHRGISLARAVEYFAGEAAEMTEKKKQALSRLEGFLRSSDSVKQELEVIGNAHPPIANMSLPDFVRAGLSIIWAESLIRGAPHGTQNESIFDLVVFAGLASSHAMEAPWLREEILGQDGMIDSFVAVHLGDQARLDQCCPCPFTCWNQHRNCRYQNEGSRIDYILVDGCLKDKLMHDACHAVCPEIAERSSESSLFNGPGFVKGLRRVTEDNKFSAAPTDGSGLTPLSEALCELQFIGLPKTGLMTTPPQLSDHIGVCCLLKLELSACGGKCDSGGCQYKPAHPSIKSFFTKKTPSLLSDQTPSTPTFAATCESAAKKPRHEEVIED